MDTATHAVMFEMLVKSTLKKRLKKLEKKLSKLSFESGVPVRQLKEGIEPFLQEAMDNFFGYRNCYKAKRAQEGQ